MQQRLYFHIYIFSLNLDALFPANIKARVKGTHPSTVTILSMNSLSFQTGWLQMSAVFLSAMYAASTSDSSGIYWLYTDYALTPWRCSTCTACKLVFFFQEVQSFPLGSDSNFSNTCTCLCEHISASSRSHNLSHSHCILYAPNILYFNFPVIP